ncbi:MAG: hypothetical protein R3E03_06960 [Novosphingobium sp.]
MKHRIFLVTALAGALAACAGAAGAPPETAAQLKPDGWSEAERQAIDAWSERSAARLDPASEARIAAIVAGMTLEQKIGQMTQPEIRSITPDQVRQYYIGTILNGGGAWPQMNKRASVCRLGRRWQRPIPRLRSAPT